jgi:hypothetical protein
VGGEETRDDRYQVLLFKVAWSCSCKITMKIELLIISGYVLSLLPTLFLYSVSVVLPQVHKFSTNLSPACRVRV